MTSVGGRPLIDHALERFRAVGVRRVTIIINEESDDCRQWLGDHCQDFDLDLIVRTTPSSYASFQLVAARLAGTPALITTVDSILPVDDFRLFVRSAAGFPKDAVVLGVTSACRRRESAVGDAGRADGRILRLGGESGSHVTAGLYWLPAIELAEPRAGFRAAARLSQMAGRARPPVYGVVLPLVFDIDRARDVEAAELAGFRASMRAPANERGQNLLWASIVSRRTRLAASMTTQRSWKASPRLWRSAASRVELVAADDLVEKP